MMDIADLHPALGLAWAVQLGLATLGVIVWGRLALPDIRRHPDDPYIADVWGPMCVMLPLLPAAYAGGPLLGGGGAVTVVGPALLTAVGAGLLLVLRPRIDSAGPSGTTAVLWVATGAFFVMLTAAGDVTLWVGQFTLAFAAVALWLYLPDDPPENAAVGAARIGVLGTAVVAAGLAGATFVALGFSRSLAPITAAIPVVHGIVLLALAVTRTEPGAATRLVGWSGFHAIHFGFGMLSLAVLIPSLADIRQGRPSAAVPMIAYGAGHVAWEAALLLAAFAALVGAGRFAGPRLTRLVGLALLVGAAAVVLIRLRAGTG